MQKYTANDPETKSADIIGDNVEALKGLFPDAFTEGKVDFEVLKQLLGGAVDESDEKYGLNWHGKRAARQLALTPSTGTLRPCPDESVDWDTTQNLMIEGDNLEVLKLLQKSYTGKVKLIYIDPPYNTGKDFVYPDNFRDPVGNYLAMTGQLGADGVRLASSTESSGRFHTKWLNMLYPRLRLARSLLRNDGLIFVSIDDGEIANLRLLMDEIFGPDRLIAELVWKNKYNAGALTKGFSSVHEYILCYSSGDIANITSPLGSDEIKQYKAKDDKFAERGGYVTQPLATSSKDPRPNLRYPISVDGEEIWPEKQWIWSRDRVEAALANDEVVVNRQSGKVSVRVKQYLRDESGEMRQMKPLSILTGPYNQEGSKETASLFGSPGVFSFPKPVELIRHLVGLTINDTHDDEAIVLDFFAGSGTTGHSVMLQNAIDGGSRRFILVQLPEVLDESAPENKAAVQFCSNNGLPLTLTALTKERLARAASQVSTSHPDAAGDRGFRVFKLDSSNIEAWAPDRENLSGSLTDAIEHLKGDRTEQDVLVELLLKLGLDLTVQTDTRNIAGRTIYSFGAGTLLACLAESVGKADTEMLAVGLAAWHKELDPAGDTTVVFRDSAFADDVAKTNLTAILEQHGLTTVRSL